MEELCPELFVQGSVVYGHMLLVMTCQVEMMIAHYHYVPTVGLETVNPDGSGTRDAREVMALVSFVCGHAS